MQNQAVPAPPVNSLVRSSLSDSCEPCYDLTICLCVSRPCSGGVADEDAGEVAGSHPTDVWDRNVITSSLLASLELAVTYLTAVVGAYIGGVNRLKDFQRGVDMPI